MTQNLSRFSFYVRIHGNRGWFESDAVMMETRNDGNPSVTLFITMATVCYSVTHSVTQVSCADSRFFHSFTTRPLPFLATDLHSTVYLFCFVLFCFVLFSSIFSIISITEPLSCDYVIVRNVYFCFYAAIYCCSHKQDRLPLICYGIWLCPSACRRVQCCWFMIDWDSSFNINGRCSVTTEPDQGFHGYDRAWILCGVAMEVSIKWHHGIFVGEFT